MAKVNYSFQKKQKELARKKKQEEKEKARLAKRKLAEQGAPEQVPTDDPTAGQTNA